MKNAKFRVADKINVFKIPFKLDDESLCDWLNSLLTLDRTDSVDKLFYLIETLNKIKISIQLRLTLLKSICTYLKIFVDQVGEHEERTFPLSNAEIHLIEVIVWSYLGLVQGFIRVAKNTDDQGIKLFSLYKALFSIAEAFLHISATYMLPSKGLWRYCYYIYYMAEKERLLLEPLTYKGLEDETIDKLFKQIIIFGLSHPNQFRAREMKTIFQFIGKYAIQLNIERRKADYKKTGIFIFDVEQDTQPVESANLDDFQRLVSTRNFEITLLAKKIYLDMREERVSQGTLKSINQALFLRFIKTLSMTQKRQFTRVEKKCMANGVVGFDFLCHYLRNLNDKIEVKINTEIDVKTKKPSRLEILSRGEEHNYRMRTIFKKDIEENEQIKKIFQLGSKLSADSEIWNTENVIDFNSVENHHLHASDFTLINSSAKGYALTWNHRENKVKLGDLFGIVGNNSEHIEVTVIKRMSQLSENVLQLHVELLGSKSYPVYMTKESDQQSGKWAILLPKIEASQATTDSLIFKTGDYQVGESIFIQRNNYQGKCRLIKLLHVTPSITHATLSYQ